MAITGSAAFGTKAVLWHLGSLTFGFLLALRVHTYFQPGTTANLAAFCLLTAFLARAKYAASEMPAVRLLQLIGAVSAAYALLHYPLMPVMPTAHAHAVYIALLLLWVASIVCGIACVRIPSLALIPPAFLVWSVGISWQVTGLLHWRTLDVLPLSEVAACLGIGLVIVRLYALSPRCDETTRNQFAGLIFVFAVCMHLANYFWSAAAKITLDGPFLAWVTFNNPLHIYLAALDLGHITFSQFEIAKWLAAAIDKTHVVANAAILAAQTLAVLGFLMSKRALVLLLIVFDALHLGIAIAAGANFLPWVLLNIAITIVLVAPWYQKPNRATGLLAAAFIIAAPYFGTVAALGWYDSGAHNRRYFEAEDRDGKRYYVSPNFFTFYSYPIAHDSYGVPEPTTAFDTLMNGGADTYELALAGRTCDTARLIPGTPRHAPPPPTLAPFVIRYHQMAQDMERTLGVFPYNLYPHHFYGRLGQADAFDRLDKGQIAAYVFRRESVCLSFEDGKFVRRVVSTGEYRIELPK